MHRRLIAMIVGVLATAVAGLALRTADGRMMTARRV